MSFNILIDPNPALRTRCKEVNLEEYRKSSSLQDEIYEKFSTMHKIMIEQNGIGLAANQIGLLERIIVIDLNPDRDHDLLERDVLFMINPIINHYSNKKTLLEEGCLSVNQQLVQVSRPDSIVCTYFTINGKQKTIKARGLLAKVIQHEIDHLNGKLIIDFLDEEN